MTPDYPSWSYGADNTQGKPAAKPENSDPTAEAEQSDTPTEGNDPMSVNLETPIGQPERPDTGVPPTAEPPAVTPEEEAMPPHAPKNADMPNTDDADADASQNADTQEEGEVKKEELTLRDHLRELRTRVMRSGIAVVIGFLIAYAFVETLIHYIYLPLENVLPQGSGIIYTGLPEGFLIRVKVAFVSGIFIGSPYIFYQIWSFIAPGLYSEEKRFVMPVALLSAFCFAGGASFCYFIVFPLAFEFFMGFSEGPFTAMPSMTEYLDFTLQLIVAFGLIFEMPLFTFFLARMGLVTATMLRKARRYAIVGTFIVAAILTPPDVYSQMLMAVPMLLLYEISIWVAAVFGKKKKEPEKPQEPEEPQEPEAA